MEVVDAISPVCSWVAPARSGGGTFEACQSSTVPCFCRRRRPADRRTCHGDKAARTRHGCGNPGRPISMRSRPRRSSAIRDAFVDLPGNRGARSTPHARQPDRVQPAVRRTRRPVERAHYTPCPDYPEVLCVLSNDRKDGKPIGLIDGGDFWHSNSSLHRDRPSLGHHFVRGEEPAPMAAIPNSLTLYAAATKRCRLRFEMKSRASRRSQGHPRSLKTQEQARDGFSAPPGRQGFL